jgi:hypothetical protein
MDKAAMDQIKLGISHLLKAKIQKSQQVILKRQKLGKLDDNDMFINPLKEFGKKKEKARMSVAVVP